MSRCHFLCVQISSGDLVMIEKEDTSAMGFLPHRILRQDIGKIQQLGWEPKTNLEEIYRIDIERLRVAK